MTISLKHYFTSAKGDGTDPTLVQPSAWNHEHVITMATAHLLGRATAGTGVVEEIAVGPNLTLDATNLRVADNPAFTGSGALELPGGNTAARPGSPAASMLRWNNDINTVEWYNGSAWVSPLTSVGGDFTQTRGADIASASTLDLRGATGGMVAITGATTINTIIGNSGAQIALYFTAVLSIANTAIDNPPPFGITTKTGDVMTLRFDGAGGPIMQSYMRANGQPLLQPFAIEFVMDGGGAALTLGQKGVIELPFDGAITQVTALLDRVGTITLDIYACTYGNYDIATHPSSADSISGGVGLAVAAAAKLQNTTLSGWTTGFSKGNIWSFAVANAGGGTVQRATVSVRGIRLST